MDALQNGKARTDAVAYSIDCSRGALRTPITAHLADAALPLTVSKKRLGEGMARVPDVCSEGSSGRPLSFSWTTRNRPIRRALTSRCASRFRAT